MNSKLALVLLLLPNLAYSDNESLIASDVSSLFSGSNNKLNLEIAEDKKTAEIKFAGYNFTNYIKTNISVKSPFDKDKGYSNFADFDGLSSSTTLSIGLDYKRVLPLEDDAEAASKETALCDSFFIKLPTCSAGEVRKAVSEYIKAHSASENFALCSAYQIQGIQCNEKDAPELIAEIFSKSRQRIFAPLTKAKLIPIKFTIGRASHEYLDLTSIEKQEDNKDSGSVSAGYGYLTDKWFSGVSLEYQKSFKSGDVMDYCTPINDASTATQCEEIAFGKPTEKVRHNASIEFRYRPLNENFAVAVKFTKDFKNNEEFAEIPIYLLESEKLGLNSGIRITWDSKSNDIGGKLFFGTSFNFF